MQCRFPDQNRQNKFYQVSERGDGKISFDSFCNDETKNEGCLHDGSDCCGHNIKTEHCIVQIVFGMNKQILIQKEFVAPLCTQNSVTW